MGLSPLKKFAIFSFPRSGSTYLCSRLTEHPNILCHYEVFHPDEIVTVRGFADDAPAIRTFTPQTRDDDPGAFLQTLFKYNLGAQAVGFKIFVGHSDTAHDLILNDKGIAKILLTRSTVDAYVSMQIARKTGEWAGPSGRDESVKVNIDAGGLLAFDDLVNRYLGNIEERLKGSGQTYLKVRYEDIVSDEAAFDAILGFLGVERGSYPLTPFTTRQNSEAVEDKVSNLKQVLEELVRLFRESH